MKKLIYLLFLSFLIPSVLYSQEADLKTDIKEYHAASIFFHSAGFIAVGVSLSVMIANKHYDIKETRDILFLITPLIINNVIGLYFDFKEHSSKRELQRLRRLRTK